MKTQRTNVALWLVILALAGCREPTVPERGAPPPPAAHAGADDEDSGPLTADLAPLAPRIIAPQTTDAAIDWAPAVNPQLYYHYVWVDSTRKPNGKLLVFLPGTGARPGGARNSSSRKPRGWDTT